MFHVSQVRPLTKADQKAIAEQKAKHEARKTAKGSNVTQMHPAS